MLDSLTPDRLAHRLRLRADSLERASEGLGDKEYVTLEMRTDLVPYVVLILRDAADKLGREVND